MKNFRLRQNSTRRAGAGFTIMELVVTLAVFAILAAGVLGAVAVLIKTTKQAREKTVVANMAANYLEVVRNMPYSRVGTVSGNPNGSLPDESAPASQIVAGITYRITYEVTYIHDPADPVPSNPNYKQVKVTVKNSVTGSSSDFVTTVAPQTLNTDPNLGAILVKVIDAKGQPVPAATISIQRPTTAPFTYNLSRLSDAFGNWTEIGLPSGVNAYRITASKAGMTTDQTLPQTAANPNPKKPDVTVLAGQTSQITLEIDLPASLTIRTLNAFCAPIGGVSIFTSGGPVIGTTSAYPPQDILWYSATSVSNSSGLIFLNNLLWGNYIPLLLTGQGYMIYGSAPAQEIYVNAGSSQTYTFMLGPYTDVSLLVIVKDASTGAPLEGAQVHLQKGGSVPQDYYGISGGSVWLQNDWSGGSGWAAFSSTTPNGYWSDDGNLDISATQGVRIKKTSGNYAPAGTMESSTFDTNNSANDFTTLSWLPATQDPGESLKFQIASNNDNATWDFVGPDGTAASFYEISGSEISAVHDNQRYIRYRAFLGTTAKTTPQLTSLSLNYFSECNIPGQVIFPGLTPSGGGAYTLTVSMPGYQTQVIPMNNLTTNQSHTVLLSP